MTRGLDISVLGDHLLLQPLALTGVRWWASARSTQVKLVERYLVGGTWPRLLSMTEGQLLCWSPPLMLTLVRGAQFSGTQEVECLGSPGLGLSLCFRRGSKSGHPYPQALGGYRRLSTHTQSWGLFPLTKGKLKPRCLPPPTFLSHTHFFNTQYCDTLCTGQVMGGVRSLALREGSRNSLTHRTSRARECLRAPAMPGDMVSLKQ